MNSKTGLTIVGASSGIHPWDYARRGTHATRVFGVNCRGRYGIMGRLLASSSQGMLYSRITEGRADLDLLEDTANMQVDACGLGDPAPDKKWTVGRGFLLVTLLAVLLCTVAVTSLLHANHHKSPTVQESDDVMCILRELREKNARPTDIARETRRRASALVAVKFPWLKKFKPRPNSILHPSSQSHGPIEIVNGVAGSNKISDCLLGLITSSNDNYVRVGNQVTLNHASNDLFHRPRLHDVNGGLCLGLPSCSLIMLLQNPLTNVQLHFNHCKKYPTEETCNIANANTMTLREWILLQGSRYFQQITFHSDICNKSFDISLHKQPHLEQWLKPSRVLPCWYQHKLHLDEMTSSERALLLDYTMNNMESWFSVIGLVEHASETLQMMKQAFPAHVSQCKFVKQSVEISDAMNSNSNRANHKEHHDSYDPNDLQYLHYDYEVQKALAPDSMIFKRAQQIFAKQKQVLFNTI